MRSPLILTAATLAAHTVALPSGAPYKRNQNSTYEQDTQKRAEAVKAAFQTAWDGYYQCVSWPCSIHTREEVLTT
jgi:hypothetical protein